MLGPPPRPPAFSDGPTTSGPSGSSDKAELPGRRVSEEFCADLCTLNPALYQSGLGDDHVGASPITDDAYLFLSRVKSLPAANYSDRHCCPFTDDACCALPLAGVNLLGQYLLQAYTPVGCVR